MSGDEGASWDWPRTVLSPSPARAYQNRARPGWPYSKDALQRCHLCIAQFGEDAHGDLGLRLPAVLLDDHDRADDVVRFHLAHRDRGEA